MEATGTEGTDGTEAPPTGATPAEGTPNEDAATEATDAGAKDVRHRRSRRGRSSHGRLIVGIVFMLLGTLFLLDTVFYIDVGDIWQFWPLILVTIGVLKVVRPRRRRSRGFGVFLTFLGGWLLLDQIGIADADDSWPVLLMVVGVLMIVSSLSRARGAVFGHGSESTESAP